MGNDTKKGNRPRDAAGRGRFTGGVFGRGSALEEYDPVADREALANLATWCGRFSPLVGIEDAATPDSLLLDVTGIAHFFGGETSLVNRVMGDFAGVVLRSILVWRIPSVRLGRWPISKLKAES